MATKKTAPAPDAAVSETAETPLETPAKKAEVPNVYGLNAQARAGIRTLIDEWRDAAMHHSSFLEHLEQIVKE
jgi:hypothetical protein